ncbi:MAG: N-acetyl-gamma-glutamyl-phosphate reductase [Phycisphaerales bacterium JB039]
MSAARIAIVGAGGYSGEQLVGLLLRHPEARIVGLFGSGRDPARTRLEQIAPRLAGAALPGIEPASPEAIAATRPDAVFLCTPHEASARLAPQLLALDLVTLDLSGAFRLSPEQTPSVYGFAHEDPAGAAGAVYGLPERNRDRLAGASLIAVPGCYPTASVLALAPLAPALRAGATAIVDAVSGVSGAGRGAAERTSFCEVSLAPYGVLSHRHQPEIARHAGVDVLFTPHLGPFDRGILATIHIELAEGWDAGRVGEAYSDAYESERFVRLLAPGVWPSVAAVRDTNCCDIAWAVDEQRRRAIVFSAIDNLIKGAAGQAVQCMNIRLGFPEATGLDHRAA